MSKSKIRSMIVAEKGKTYICWDLSQAESWVVAYESGQEEMKYALAHGDIHTQTAGSATYFKDVPCEHIWKKGEQSCQAGCGSIVTSQMRYLGGKKSNHAFGYGMGAYKYAETINSESDSPPYLTMDQKTANRNHANWLGYYYRIPEWHKSIQEELNSLSRYLTTAYGRRRKFYQKWGDELFKEAYAFKPQSTVGDHFNGLEQPINPLPGGLLELYRRIKKGVFGDGTKILNQSHDSGVVETDTKDPLDMIGQINSIFLRPIIIKGESFTIPVDFKYGDRWEENMQEVKI